MARIKVEPIVDHLSSDIRRALESAINEVLPNSKFDPYELFRAFKRAVDRKCSTWEDVPDDLVEMD